MSEIDKEKFGAFVAALRREKGLTQRELSEGLHISDKAVSKWERGLSLPDVALLQPLSEQLGVTLTELLRGERSGPEAPMAPDEVEELVSGAVTLSAGERRRRREDRRRRACLLALAVLAGLAGDALLLRAGRSPASLVDSVFLIQTLYLFFGGWMGLFAKETLPDYYDRNQIGSYSSGPVRLNLPGIRFNNSNWPHILRAGFLWMTAVLALAPYLWLALTVLVPAGAWRIAELPVTLAAVFTLFVPLYAAGKKYE